MTGPSLILKCTYIYIYLFTCLCIYIYIDAHVYVLGGGGGGEGVESLEVTTLIREEDCIMKEM